MEKYRKVFQGNPDFNKSAFLNWRIYKNDPIGNLISMGQGFIKSSKFTLELCIKDNHDKIGDELIFPILTNLNHGIELYFKALIWTLNSIQSNGDNFPKTHNLYDLMLHSLKGIEALDGKEVLEEFTQTSITLLDYIKEINETIKTDSKSDNLDFSRYPLNRKLESHFYLNTYQNVEIDMPNLLEIINKIEIILDDRVNYFYYHRLLE
jgi:hypothetical protein